jgi:polyvinyl alcohol dehydrogenase (cytochrome)
VLGQKSGVAYALDPDKQGEVLWQTRVGKGGGLGGSQWGSATDGQNLYVALSDIGFTGIAPDKTSPQGFRLLPNPNQGGGLFALRLSAGERVWSAKPASACDDRPGCPRPVAGGYGHSRRRIFRFCRWTHASLLDGDGRNPLGHGHCARLRDSEWAAGPRWLVGRSGPVVAGGMLYVNSGYAQFGGAPGNVLLAFSVDGH